MSSRTSTTQTSCWSADFHFSGTEEAWSLSGSCQVQAVAQTHFSQAQSSLIEVVRPSNSLFIQSLTWTPNEQGRNADQLLHDDEIRPRGEPDKSRGRHSISGAGQGGIRLTRRKREGSEEIIDFRTKKKKSEAIRSKESVASGPTSAKISKVSPLRASITGAAEDGERPR